MQTKAQPKNHTSPTPKSPESSLSSSIARRPARPILISILLITLIGSLLSGIYLTNSIIHADTPTNAPPVLTYKYDTYRSGQNPNETILTTSNVTSSQFGKRVTYPVDGFVYAQPLYIPNLTINGQAHNAVFVATAHDSVYAFDADQRQAAAPLWHTSFINPPSSVPINGTDVSCSDGNPEMGVLGTPTIDLSNNTIYMVAATKDSGALHYRLHALNILTGAEQPNSPVLIQASISGTGAGSSGGVLKFDPVHTNQRPGLLLLNGQIYTAWASWCDKMPYHGWIMAYDETTLQQTSVFNTSPNTQMAGIWQTGGGLVADSTGHIYAITGNGPFDLNNGKTSAGTTFLRLNTQGGISINDYFTPFNQSCLGTSGADLDLGSSGPLLIPSTSEIIGAGKEGRLYVLNSANMGKYTTIANPCSNQSRTNVDQIIQEFPPHTFKQGLWGSLAYWQGNTGEFIFGAGAGDHLKAFKLTSGKLSTSPTSQSPETFAWPGGSPSVSSNGTTPGTGIVWQIAPGGILRAYDATNLAHELYNSGQNASRDGLGSYTKFTTPVVSNGEVFVGTKTSLAIFGLLNGSPTPTATPTPSPTPGGGSGKLTGSRAASTTPVYLNATGPVDWAHWGLLNASTFDHKANVTPQISNFTVGGAATVQQLTNNAIAYNWASCLGTPDCSASNTKTGVFVTGVGNGFTITIPAGTTLRTLKLYVSVSQAQGNLTATLNDGSTPDFTDTTLQNASGITNVVYTIAFQAASSGQTLTVSFTMQNSLGASGYVSLQSATLS